MRMTDREAGQAVRERLEPLGRTGSSIIYAEKSEPMIAIKAEGFWLDGEMYDHAAIAEDASETFKREATIYGALGPHPHILKCFGAAYLEGGEETNPKEREAWALKLERAPHGNLRERILDDASPSMARRVQLAVDLAETLQYVHERGVIWGDISTRSILVFDDLHIKLSDFAGSSLQDVYPELLFSCEPRYWVPTTNPPTPTKDIFAQELFALGTSICEITEWAVPYGEIEIEELQERLRKGEHPHVGEDNPAKSIIRKLWDSDYSSAKEAAEALREVSARIIAEME
ncbi:kinase-like domain-containing protein [Plectosphaerella plurivora]|uniref:Kinase-like domain-containing protein n=1 Tax=Plectosphaerella plurivora TaxID=936078 RepID=A0A9P8VKJ7_9PEZI|nr:kinase-like domain-containing protein [Plectosphaerella plurivora]